ncbi:glycerophosphodiester phosphodiesterase [Rhizobium deserti]|uniref:Glycerophosphodiester phosphodiesterase n=1 Tax=Rhizobium deserti TaxID=2547961 RepID=A0A4R5UN45_9HYPH|nr:glycerophosphodiester phosphodiesterase [Rhizobium deserti]TDK39315.1 glycerophosphodiester phosphodiesterase [Rhizobium deserti]
MADAVHGLGMEYDGHFTRLKWHRLRRSLSDSLFAANVMLEGFKLGASMELDLRVRGDGGFVVLHDEVLEGETTGQGLIRDAAPASIRQVTIRDGGHVPILSEDLADMLETAHPQALLQFDMKDRLDVIGRRGLAHLQEYFSAAGPSIIVSGADLDLILAVKQQIPDILRGIDPTDKLLEIYGHQGLKAVEAELKLDLLGPTEPDTVYLAWQLILKAAGEGLDLIALTHDVGKRVDAWTYNMKVPSGGFSPSEAQEFSALMALKPDQITTDEAPATEQAWLALQAR